MKFVFLTIVLFSAGWNFAQKIGETAQTPKQPNASQKLEQTCSSIKSGEIKDPPAQLAETCRALEEEQANREKQSDEKMKFLAGKYCRAPWAPDSPERARMHGVLVRIRPASRRQYPGESIAYIAVRSSVINAWTVVEGKQSFVCMPTAMINFMSNDGELAFIMGHETGHAVDEACKGRPKQDKALQRTCESRADAVGFDLLVKSGFNPFDASAAFGKLEMYTGDIRTDQNAQMQALGRDHPMTPDRIEHMRNMLHQYNVVLKGPLAR